MRQAEQVHHLKDDDDIHIANKQSLVALLKEHLSLDMLLLFQHKCAFGNYLRVIKGSEMTTKMRAEFKMWFIHKAGTLENPFLAYRTVCWMYIFALETALRKACSIDFFIHHKYISCLSVSKLLQHIF